MFIRRKKRILLRKELFYCISDFSMYYSVNWVDRSFVQNDKCIRLAFSRCFNLPRLDFYRIWLGRKMEFLLLRNTRITSSNNLERFESNMLNKVKCDSTHLKDDNDFFFIPDPDLSWILSHNMWFSKLRGKSYISKSVNLYLYSSICELEIESHKTRLKSSSKGDDARRHSILDILFSSNHNIHKSW